MRAKKKQRFASVVQWQNSSLPSWSRGFDSHHSLHFFACTHSSAGQSTCLLSSRSGVRISLGTPTTPQWFGVLPISVRLHLVGVAQLVRASDCGSEGRGFESHHPPQTKRKPNPRFTFSFYLQAIKRKHSDLECFCISN